MLQALPVTYRKFITSHFKSSQGSQFIAHTSIQIVDISYYSALTFTVLAHL